MQDTTRPMSKAEAPENGTVVPSKLPEMDQELLFEEKLGKVLADNENLKIEKRELQKNLQELHDRLARLQTNNVRSCHPSSRITLIMSRTFYKQNSSRPKTI